MNQIAMDLQQHANLGVFEFFWWFYFHEIPVLGLALVANAVMILIDLTIGIAPK
jgi:hypothetical protein